MNILIFGKDGQLGRAFQEQLRDSAFQSRNIIHFVGRSECDLSNPSQIYAVLQASAPQIIINAAAYTAVDKAESESDLAFAINATAPEVMAKYAAEHGATLLHFSADYVFDGCKQGAYTELDQANPLSIYGKSKEAGEHKIVKAFSGVAKENGRYGILRTSWVYGDGSNFIRTILDLAKERPTLKVINDQYGVPTSAQWLVNIGLHLVLDGDDLRKFSSGIYHAVPPGETSWHSLASFVVKTALDAGANLQASPLSIAAIPTSDYPLPAQRPMNSCLSTQKLQFELERLGLVSKLPHWNTPWDEQVRAYVKQLFVN